MCVEPQGYTIHALRRSAMYLPLFRLNNSGLVGWARPPAFCKPRSIGWAEHGGTQQQLEYDNLLGGHTMNQQLKAQWREEFDKADVQTVRQMLTQEPELVNVRVRRSNQAEPRWGPLFVASVKLNSLDKAKALIEAGANINNSELGTHWPSTDYEINRYFIERGIDVNQPSFPRVPCHRCYRIGLLSADDEARARSQLHVGIHWADDVAYASAARYDKELACTFMLIRAGANVNAQARTGLDDEPIMENEHGIRYGRETPLHSAARFRKQATGATSA